MCPKSLVLYAKPNYETLGSVLRDSGLWTWDPKVCEQIGFQLADDMSCG